MFEEPPSSVSKRNERWGNPENYPIIIGQLESEILRYENMIAIYEGEISQISQAVEEHGSSHTGKSIKVMSDAKVIVLEALIVAQSQLLAEKGRVEKLLDDHKKYRTD